MKTASEIFVSFHIGRGGKFYNGGYVSYIGEKTINDLITLNSEHLFYHNKDEHGKFCPPFYSDSNGNVIITEEQTKTNVGDLDFDGIYNTYFSLSLNDCTEEQLNLIQKDKSYYKSIELSTELERLLSECQL